MNKYDNPWLTESWSSMDISENLASYKHVHKGMSHVSPTFGEGEGGLKRAYHNLWRMVSAEKDVSGFEVGCWWAVFLSLATFVGCGERGFFTLVSFSFVQLSFEKQIRIRKRYCQVTIHNKQHKGDILKCYRIVSHSLFNRTNLIHMNMQLVSSVWRKAVWKWALIRAKCSYSLLVRLNMWLGIVFILLCWLLTRHVLMKTDDSGKSWSLTLDKHGYKW